MAGGKTMKYDNIVKGTFIKRINRFICDVYVDGIKEQVHIKNTGRLTELLHPDVPVFLERSNDPKRKTRFSLIAVSKHGVLVNIDSQAPNVVVAEALAAGKLTEFGSVDLVRREMKYRNSRFDLYFEKGERKGFIEVKGVTLEKNGVALFPDAPTSRGKKHLLEMAMAAKEGYMTAIIFLIQMKGCLRFEPNKTMDAFFTESLYEAARHGVQILAYDSIVTEKKIVLDQSVPVRL